MLARSSHPRALAALFALSLLGSPSAARQAEELRSVDASPPEGLSTDDWTGIRAAYDAQRHAVLATDGGFRARNPGQRWTTDFDGRGFTTRPHGGGWEWGLELVRYGFPGAERELSGSAAASAHGGRVAYRWDEWIEEWYVNDRRGLEHGYTIGGRPEGRSGDARLQLELAVRGALQPEVANGGRDVRFLDDDGAPALTYSGLVVLDAGGARVDAWFELSEGALLLTVDERDARYPLEIDPVAQQAYLKSSDPDSSDRFGYSVAASGDTVVVGAPYEDSAAVGVDGDASDDTADNAGAAYVFVRSGSTWSQQAYLKASNTDGNDQFGWSVAISGDTVVVGAHLEASNATGVGGNQGNNSASFAGAAYVFVRSGSTWSQQAYLKADDSDGNDQFGTSVSIDGDTVVVGSPYEDSGATGVGGDPSDDSAANSGAAYVFVRSGSAWSPQAYIKASNPEVNDNFGASVAVSGDTVVVGSTAEDSSATGVDGAQGDNAASDSGAAYVFTRSGTTWSQQAYLKASNTDSSDYFGFSVSLSGDTALIGAYGEDSAATGVNGDDTDDSALFSGAGYVFLRSGSTWSQQAYLKASNTGSSDRFGFATSVSGDRILIGAYSEDGNATGVGGDDTNNGSINSGAAYLFARTGSTWSQQAYMKASNTGSTDSFGLAVSLSGETAVVGAPDEDSDASGVDGDGSNNLSSGSGAAYAFTVAPDPPYVQRCFCDAANAPCSNPDAAAGCANSTGVGALLTATGSASIADQGTDPLVLHASQARPDKACVWLQGETQQQTPFHDGNLCVGDPTLRLPGFGCGPFPIGTLDASGAIATDDATYGFDVVAAALCKGDDIAAAAPTTRDYQLWFRDGMGPCGSGSNLTNAVQIDWVP